MDSKFYSSELLLTAVRTLFCCLPLASFDVIGGSYMPRAWQFLYVFPCIAIGRSQSGATKLCLGTKQEPSFQRSMFVCLFRQKESTDLIKKENLETQIPKALRLCPLTVFHPAQAHGFSSLLKTDLIGPTWGHGFPLARSPRCPGRGVLQ